MKKEEDSYVLITNEEVVKDIKDLLLEKFIYLVNNVEFIFDYIESTYSNSSDNNCSINKIEFLLLDYKSLINEEFCEKIEAYRKQKENINSYDLGNKIFLTEFILNYLINYIINQKKDTYNKEKKLELITKYYQLIEHIKSVEKIDSQVLHRGDRSIERFNIRYTKSLSTPIWKKYSLSQIDDKIISSLFNLPILRDVNDVGVGKNYFIDNNALIIVTDEDKQNVLDTIKKEKKFIKKIKYNIYY